MFFIVTNSPIRRTKIFPSIAIGLMFTAMPVMNAQTNAAQRVAVPPAENVSDKPSEFEVASIKLVDPASTAMHTMGVQVFPGGRVLLSGFTLKNLVMIAFNLGYWQISGGDEWAGKDLYDIEAKPPETSDGKAWSLGHSLFAMQDERLRQMLQVLLIDRFQLKFHRDTKTGAVSLLKWDGKTHRLQPTKITYEKPIIGAEVGYSGSIDYLFRGRWLIINTSMPQLAKFAGDYVLHHPVLDETGLSGSFDYKSPQNMIDPGAPDIDFSAAFFSLIPELGLKLQSAKGPVETFIIDSARKPSPN